MNNSRLKRHSTNRMSSWIAMILLFVVIISGCTQNNPPQTGEQIDKNDRQAISVQAEQAEELYKKNCIHCHGTDLQGRAGQESNISQVGLHLSEAEIYDTIVNGRDFMPAFADQLSEKELQLLAEWLSTKK